MNPFRNWLVHAGKSLFTVLLIMAASTVSAALPFSIRSNEHPRVLIDAARISEIAAAAQTGMPLNGTAFPQVTGTITFDLLPFPLSPSQNTKLPLLDRPDQSRNHIFIRHYDESSANNPGTTLCGTDVQDTDNLCMQLAFQPGDGTAYVAAINFSLTSADWHSIRVSWNTASHTGILQVDLEQPVTLVWRTSNGSPVDWMPAEQSFEFSGRDGLDNIRLYSSDSPGQSALLAEYTMSESGGLRLHDTSGNNHDARINPGVTWGTRSAFDPDAVIYPDGVSGSLSVINDNILAEAWADFIETAGDVASQLNSGGMPVDVSTAAPNAIFNVSQKLGLAYRVTGYQQYLTAATIFADQLLAVEPGAGGDYPQAGRIEAMGILYDWLFDELSGIQLDALASAIKDTIIEQERYICGDNNPLTPDWRCTSPAQPNFIGTHAHQNNTETTAGLLAIIDEYPELEPVLLTLYENFVNGYNPARAWISVDGGHHMGWDYGATYTFLDSIQLWQMATTDIDMLEPWQGKLIDRYIWGLRGDYNYPASGDAFKGKGTTPGSEDVVLFALWGSRNFGNSHAQDFYDNLIVPEQTGYRFNELMYWQPGLAATPVTTLDYSHLFRNAGQAVMRDTWDYVNATLLEFKSTSFWSYHHHHLDQNAFTIFYKSPLLVESGYYDSSGSDHSTNYFTRTIAHNSLTVFDPAESFLRNSSYCSGSICSNDGGQQFLFHLPTLADIQPGGINHLDGITAFEYTPDYTFTQGNASKAYSADKLDQTNGFIRNIVYLRSPDYWPHPVAVVFDKVTATADKAGLEKRFLLHTVNEPEPQGTVFAPGKYRVSGNTMTIHNGEGMLFSQTLLPENPVITKVGGNDAGGNDYRFLVPVGNEIDGYQDINFPPSIEPPSIYTDMGEWRIEITADTPSQREYFLHVLSVDDYTPGRLPPAVSNLTSDTAAVAMIEDSQIIAFAKQDSPATSVDWDMPGSDIAGYLVSGLAPDTAFDVRIIGSGLPQNPYRAIIEQSQTGNYLSSDAGLLPVNDVLPMDYDNDGYPLPVDCDDMNASIHPGALEIPIDGNDQDCQGGDSTLSVREAAYASNNNKLIISAATNGGITDQLAVEGYQPMSWISKDGGYWYLKENNVPANPGSVIITGIEGSVQVNVSSQ